jgi:uncharacterized protein YndB with AHSA1/START domain
MTAQTDNAVLKSISVGAGVERALNAFTADIDGWWPRDHHICTGTPKQVTSTVASAVAATPSSQTVRNAIGGRVILWEPPYRLILAWLIDGNWHYDPDQSRTSEVEVCFTSQADGTTRVDLEHRHFERMGEGGNNMRMMVEAPGGWPDILRLYAAYVEKGESK